MCPPIARAIHFRLWPVLLALSVLLGGCGYHLRGAVDLPKGLNRIYLDGASMTLREQFRRTLRASSGELANSAESAEVVIKIADERSEQRALSLSSRGRSNELELSYHLFYSVFKADQTLLLDSQPVDIKRQYFNNQQDIVAKDNEQQIIRSEMLQQAVRMMADRIRLVLVGGK